MSCGRIKPKASKTCTGNRNRLVEFFSRNIKPDSNSFTMDIQPVFSLWCQGGTVRPVKNHDGTNTERDSITVTFYHPYGVDVREKQLCKFNSKYFEVSSVENINMENRTLRIDCVELGNLFDSDGTTELQANWRSGG